MKLGPIVLKLRLGNTRFKENIAGAAELAYATKNTLLKECAFVIPISEISNPNLLDNGLNQKFTEKFGVIIAIRNDMDLKDRTGITAYDALYDVRKELFSCILNWQVIGTESVIYYSGGNLLDINPAWIWYQYEFAMESRITDSDGVEDGYTDELEEFYTQFVLSPSPIFPYDGSLPMSELVMAVNGPDMASLVDIYDDPNNGAFSRAFSVDFDWYPKTDPWYK
jgi:hypothetical protein